ITHTLNKGDIRELHGLAADWVHTHKVVLKMTGNHRSKILRTVPGTLQLFSKQTVPIIYHSTTNP
ncbi:hypothetical protein ACJEK3_25020, partial [Escherichia coli]